MSCTTLVFIMVFEHVAGIGIGALLWAIKRAQI